MNTKVVIGFWTILIVSAVVLLLPDASTPLEFQGEQIPLNVSECWRMEIDSVHPVHMTAWDSEIFLFRQNGVFLLGETQLPPADEAEEKRFVLKGEVQSGLVEVYEGQSVSVVLESDEAFTVHLLPDLQGKVQASLVVMTLGTLVWFLGAMLIIFLV